ncbi:MAG: putative sporulation protein YtxC [Firmicutes bacterium HGW-Firmicutes-12]|nr:MAG: putative sporulation protein YtxC [Firmicutes bacterium HGW-Firmicutes-12]
MNEPIYVGTNTMPGLLYSRLSDKLETLQQEGFPFDVDIDKIGEFTFMGYSVKAKGGTKKEVFQIIKSTIANCIADIIIEEWEARIIRKIIRDNYFYYNDEEKKSILKKAKQILNPDGVIFSQREQRREKVMDKVLTYLDLHKDLILEGFINFRLKDYQDELEEIVNSAVDEFMLEKEYMEFIRLLKYFVDIQEPRIDKVKIIFKKEDGFMLLDSEFQPLKHECLEGLMLDLQENEINYDDLLISALITMAPREVELHLEEGVKPGDTINTINSVFGSRVSKCSGCKYCRPK